jgi:hypothetical protein
MTSDDKLEAFDTIDSWCFMFILIVIPYAFILFNLILYQFETSFIHAKGFPPSLQICRNRFSDYLNYWNHFSVQILKGFLLHLKHNCRVIMHLLQLWVS